VIIGDGPECSQLKDTAKKLGVEGRTTFAGTISDEELKHYYQSCSFLVLPAVYDSKGDTEGLGVVLLEAMSYGKPVIASNVGGITDIVIDQKNGFLVPPANSEMLAQALVKMTSDKELRKALGSRARKTVDEKFNWDRIVKKLIALYHNENG
jgi:glycosyltransferase involved in cell wall biosynthesis